MKRKLILPIAALIVLLAGCGLLLAFPGSANEPRIKAISGHPLPVTPGKDWETAPTPESLGWSTEGLAAAQSYSERIGSAAVMIVDDGIVVDAWGDITQNYKCHSVRKSLLSALYGIYVADGRIDISKTLGELGIDDHTLLTEAEKQATVADLLKARSGVYIPAAGETASMQEARPERGSHPPGTYWYYNNWDFNALGTIFHQETGESNIYQAFKTEIANPIGMQDYVLENLRYDYEPYSQHPYYGFLMSARDLARFGLLFARNGRWGEEQIIPESWVQESTTPYSDAGLNGGYGYMWWVAANGRHLPNVALPDGSFSASGYRGHFLLVLPKWDIVIVHRFDTFAPTGQVSGSQFGYLVRLILQAGPEDWDLDFPNAAKRLDLGEDELRRFVGRYRLDDSAGAEGQPNPPEVRVELIGGNLTVVVPGDPEEFLILVPIAPTMCPTTSTSTSLW
jgi:CubicO group peptidase (beta-lactamase class C family)